MTTNSISQYRGIFGIPATPFKEYETMDDLMTWEA